MRSRAARRLREPEDPGRATFLELFFDLVFVLALFRLSQGLLDRLSWGGAFETVVSLLAVWWVWSQTSAVADRFDPRQPAIQLLVIGCMFGAFVLAAAVPGAFGLRGLVFAGAYVAVQVGRSLYLVAATWGDERQRPEVQVLFCFSVSALPWLAGAFVHGWARGVLWSLAVAVDYAAPRLGWPTPKLGRVRAAQFTISGEFLAERQRQKIIIALGGVIQASGVAAFTGSALGADRKAAVVVAFATAVLLWRIYIYRAGEVLSGAVTAAADQLRVFAAVLYAHPVMVAGIVAISVGDELVIRHPSGHTRPAWIAVVLGGPALFLAGRAILEYALFGRVSGDRVIGVLVLIAISPAAILAPPLIVALAAGVVLAGIAVSDAARGRRRTGEPSSPPVG